MIFPTGVELSSRRRIPVLRLQQRTFYPHQFLKLMWLARHWKVLERTQDHVTVQIDGHRLSLLPGYLSIVFSEWYLEWERHYLPPFSLSGKTVLDIGAGCGETALFYLTHGADEVICVETNLKSLSFLEENAKANKWNVRIIPGFFTLDMLNYPVDFVKMDCEGCEEALLNIDRLPPIALEVHSASILQSLIAKFSLKVVGKSGPNWLVTGNSKQVKEK